MINSLSKDSHITRQKSSACTQNSPSSVQKRPYATVASSHINFNTDSYKPAQISFSGFYCPKPLENLKVIAKLDNLKEIEEYPLRDLFKAARDFISPNRKEGVVAKSLQDSTKQLIENVVEYAQNPEQVANEPVQKFLANETNHKTVKNFLEDLRDLIKHSDPEKAIDSEHPEYKSVVKKAIGEAVDVLSSVENPRPISNWLYTNKTVKKIFEKADKNQAMFTAAYSAILACALRPATIVSLPGKKHQDDKKYAAAHSISSGAIGYFTALAISTPIAAAIKKIESQHGKFLTEDTLEFYKDKKPKQVLVERSRKIATGAFQLGETKKFGVARQYLNMIPSVVTAVPQAILTIALIPIVLKYIFGLEKKAHAAAKPTPLNPAQVPSQIVVKQAIAEAVSDKDSTKNSYSILNFKSASEPARKVFQNFMGDSK